MLHLASQSPRRRQLLEQIGVDFVVLDSTDHWLTRGETRIGMLKATMAFIEKNNPPN